MAEESKDTKQGSMVSVYTRSKQIEQMEQTDNSLVKVANRRLVWVVGGFMSAVPWLFSGLFAILYRDSDICFAEQYHRFQVAFVSEGSFLWLSITVLAMSLVEFLLNGFRKKLHPKTIDRYNWLLVGAAVFEVLVILIYFLNIGKPIAGFPFTLISLVTFIAFILLSWIILFKVVK